MSSVQGRSGQMGHLSGGGLVFFDHVTTAFAPSSYRLTSVAVALYYQIGRMLLLLFRVPLCTLRCSRLALSLKSTTSLLKSIIHLECLVLMKMSPCPLLTKPKWMRSSAEIARDGRIHSERFRYLVRNSEALLKK